MSGYMQGVVASLCVNIILAYSVFLPAASGQINLGAAGFMAIGAYASAVLNDLYGVSLWASMIAALLLTGLVGFLVAAPILRTRGVYLVLATFALAEVVTGILLNVEAFGAATGMPVIEYLPIGWIIFVTLAVVLVVAFLFATRFGLAMRAVHDDENVATLFGVNVRMTQVWAFALGAALGGLAGAVYAHHYNYIQPQYFSALLSIYVLLYVLIGGTQTMWGPLLGAALFSLLPELLRGSAQWRYVIFGAIVVVMMIVRPEGLVTRTMIARLFVRPARAS
jgi:branched-chain amino acid transport system permease protein